MAGSSNRSRCTHQRFLLTFLILIALVGIFLTNNNLSQWGLQNFDKNLDMISARQLFLGNNMAVAQPFQAVAAAAAGISLPLHTNLSIELRLKNTLPARNQDLFPTLAEDHIIFVLYVHNRPQYLRVVVEGLSKVDGINETLLVISHDGFYPGMNEIVEGIKFCQVKQLFAPYSPHLFPESFPGISRNDCQNKDDPVTTGCTGQADQYGNHRSPRIVSLKHHWWWMMNTVWDGLLETRDYHRHIVFIEEDHFLYPNAYRNIQTLASIKSKKCPECWAVNLAPWDIKNRGEKADFLVTERIGNMGYGFNRTMWEKLRSSARNFCHFDDYNWDITLWASVYPSWEEKTYTLRGPRTSAVHFGRCGLHQGQKDGQPDSCQDFTREVPQVDPLDKVMNIDQRWEVTRHSYSGYPQKFNGWGGWGDPRDHQLCMEFATMYKNNRSRS